VLATVALLGGLLSDRFGPRIPTVGGMVAAVAGMVLLWWAAADRLPWLVAGLLLLGLGSGLFIPANNASVMGAAPSTHLGVAGGLLNMMRGLGTSFGVAVVGLVLALRVGTVSTGATSPALILTSVRLTLLTLALAALGAGLLSVRRRRAAVNRVTTDEII
jgi:MFS family permease